MLSYDQKVRKTAYVDGKSFSEIDQIKRGIIDLYENDFKKVDPSGRMFSMYKSIPAQLAGGKRRYSIPAATGKRTTDKSRELIYNLVDSKTVEICFNTTDPKVSLSGTKDTDSFKLYVADTGLFISLLMSDREKAEDSIYT